MAVITISRQVGSRGSYIATEVAKALGWRYYDREIVHRAAASIGLTGEADLEQLNQLEQGRSLVSRIIEALATLQTVPIVPSASLRELEYTTMQIETWMKQEGLSLDEARRRALDRQHILPIDEAQYRTLITQVVTELGQAGNAVIIGRGGQVILSALPNVLRVQIVAHYLIRVERLMEREVISRASAKMRVTESDQQRAGFLRRYFSADWLDPTLYDVIYNNSGHVSEESIIDSIVNMAHRL